MLQGWMVTRIPALIFGGIMEIGVYTSYASTNTPARASRRFYKWRKLIRDTPYEALRDKL
jgi:hypothetical protein